MYLLVKGGIVALLLYLYVLGHLYLRGRRWAEAPVADARRGMGRLLQAVAVSLAVTTYVIGGVFNKNDMFAFLLCTGFSWPRWTRAMTHLPERARTGPAAAVSDAAPGQDTGRSRLGRREFFLGSCATLGVASWPAGRVRAQAPLRPASGASCHAVGAHGLLAAAPAGLRDGHARAQRLRCGVLPGLSATGARLNRVFLRFDWDASQSRYALSPQALSALGDAIRLGRTLGVAIVLTAEFEMKPNPPLWGSPERARGFADAWRRVARMLRDVPVVVGLNLLNEPNPPHLPTDPNAYRDQWAHRPNAPSRRCAPRTRTCRSSSRAWPEASPSACAGSLVLADSKLVYSIHFYNPHAITHQHVSPGWSKTLPYPVLDVRIAQGDRHRPGPLGQRPVAQRAAGRGGLPEAQPRADLRGRVQLREVGASATPPSATSRTAWPSSASSAGRGPTTSSAAGAGWTRKSPRRDPRTPAAAPMRRSSRCCGARWRRPDASAGTRRLMVQAHAGASNRPLLLFVHASAELYGSDKVLLHVARDCAARGVFRPVVVLAEQGPLQAELRAAGVEVHHAEVAKIKRSMLSWRAPLTLWRALSRPAPGWRGSSAGARWRWSTRTRWPCWPAPSTPAASAARTCGTCTRRRAGRVWWATGWCSSSTGSPTGSWRTPAPRGNGCCARRRGWAGAARWCTTASHRCPRSHRRQTEAFRAQVRAAPDDIVVACVGRFNHMKGQALLVDAVAELQRQGRARNLRVALVGDVYAGHEDFRGGAGLPDRRAGPAGPRLPAALRAGHPSRVARLRPGRRAFARARGLRARCRGGDGLWASPVIAAAHGGCSTLEHGLSGWLFEPGSVAALAQAMDRLAHDAALRRRIGAQAAVRQAERFSLQGQLRAAGPGFARSLHVRPERAHPRHPRVPAAHGGFETFAERLAPYLAPLARLARDRLLPGGR
jgi:hypothetical protein